MSLVYVKNRRERRTTPHKPVLDDSLPEEETIALGADDLEEEVAASPTGSAKASAGEVTEDQRYYIELAEALDL